MNRTYVWIGLMAGTVLLLIASCIHYSGTSQQQASVQVTKSQEDFIKWVDFNVTYEALSSAYQMDVDSYGKNPHLNWIELLSYAAVQGGGNFNSTSVEKMREVAERITSGETMKDITKDLKYYSYYYEVYSAILGGFLGEYQCQTESGEWADCYGLKGFLPIAKGFAYSDYDDFGTSRSYGYSRPHLGHDMMGLIGTPIIAVESGNIEVLGWNQYGGWRIGIRSFDKKRYYYYAHLRQNRPFAEGLKEGDKVTAGDVIGYMGHTGYSTKENVNNIDQVHLHFGIELVFDESQKESNNEIWIDCYALCRFLSRNQSGVVKNEETKEWHRILEMKEKDKKQEAEQEKNTGKEKEQKKTKQDTRE